MTGRQHVMCVCVHTSYNHASIDMSVSTYTSRIQHCGYQYMNESTQSSQLPDIEWHALRGVRFADSASMQSLPLAERWVISALHQVCLCVKHRLSAIQRCGCAVYPIIAAHQNVMLQLQQHVCDELPDSVVDGWRRGQASLVSCVQFPATSTLHTFPLPTILPTLSPNNYSTERGCGVCSS